MRMLALTATLALLAMAGCSMPASPSRDPTAVATATPTATTPPPAPADVPEVDIHCDVDADCQVKDIGSCCGYYPRCVNKDSPTFADQVKAQCAKEGRAGVCGFPSVAGCRCVEHQCVNEVGPGVQ